MISHFYRLQSYRKLTWFFIIGKFCLQILDIFSDLFSNSENLLSKPLSFRPRHVMATIETIIQEASRVPLYLPNVSALKEALRKAREWSEKVDQVQVRRLHKFRNTNLQDTKKCFLSVVGSKCSLFTNLQEPFVLCLSC